MAYQLYTKNQLGEIVAVTPGIDERVSNLETKAIELDNYKVDVREQTITDEQKKQAQINIGGPFLTKDLNSLPEEWLDAIFPAGQFLQMDTTTIPYRSLLCNGAEVSRTQYARLFAAIGTKHGTGDGSTTFVLPNANGRVLQGTTELSQVGQYIEARLPNIKGGFGTYGWTLNGQAYGAFYEDASGKSPNFGNDGASTSYAWGHLDASRYSSVYAEGASVQPNALLTMTCIRY